MSDNETQKSNKPDRAAYNVVEGKNGYANWHNVGYVHNHSDGKGATLNLHSTPLSGKVVMRDLHEKAMDGYKKQAQDKPAASETNERQQGSEPEV